MADKTHRVKLDNGHTEDVTDQELAAIKKQAGRNFSLYTVTPIQPKKPKDVDAPAAIKASPATPEATK